MFFLAICVAALLFVFGLLVAPGSMSNFVPLNLVDTWTYLVLRSCWSVCHSCPVRSGPPR